MVAWKVGSDSCIRPQTVRHMGSCACCEYFFMTRALILPFVVKLENCIMSSIARWVNFLHHERLMNIRLVQ